MSEEQAIEADGARVFREAMQEAFMAGHWNCADAHNITDSVAYPSEFDRWFANSEYTEWNGTEYRLVPVVPKGEGE